MSLAEYESNEAQEEIADPQLSTVHYVRGPDMGGGVGGLLYTSRSGVAKYNLSNGRGDIVAQSDGNAALTWTASYEAYGKRTKETGTNNDKQRANSKDEDPTGLLNEGFRYRDIETGMFISRDPAGFVDGPNVYAYVRQNPWTAFDPEGLAETDITDAEAAKLRNFAPIVNNWVQTAINEAYAKGMDPGKYLRSTLGKDFELGRTRIEHEVDVFTPGNPSESRSDYVLVKKVADSKYAGLSELPESEQSQAKLWKNWPNDKILNPGINLNGEAVGSDKLGHFLQQGYDYFATAQKTSLQAAEEWSRATEYIVPGNWFSGGFGHASTGVASEADLEANRQGGKFFQDLSDAFKKDPKTPFVFDIKNYSGPQWNENKNPNVNNPAVQRVIEDNNKKKEQPK